MFPPRMTSNAKAAGIFSDVFLPITLPNGQLVQNRLVKAAMYEHLADLFGGPPNEYHYNLYSGWACFGWGMLITGNVQVSREHCTLGRDMVIPIKTAHQSLEPFQRLASCMKLNPTTGEPSGCLAIMQLNHSGRQSANFLGGRLPFDPPLAPSPIRVGSRSTTLMSSVVHAALFQKPRAMSLEDIDEVIASFVKGAKVAMDSGFDGIELHGAHGYLLAQFISPKSNTRSDEYSAEPKNALRLLHRIVKDIRAVVPVSFTIGVKINAADYILPVSDQRNVASSNSSHQDEDRALDHILAMAGWGLIDFIEISGGDYESPDFMMSQKNTSTSRRQAFFSRLSHKALQTVKKATRPPLILLTGGLRTPGHLQAALASEDADLLGIGRGSVLCPNLPILLRQHEQSDEWKDIPFAPEPKLDKPVLFSHWPLCWIWQHFPKISLVGAGIEMAWYIVAMRRAACQKPHDKLHPNYNIGLFGAMFWMWVWIPASKASTITWILGIILLLVLTIIMVTSFAP